MTQQREEDHIADASRIGQQHHQAIDADPETTGGWHAMSKRPNEVGVHFCHGVFFGHPVQLCFEKILLQNWIVQFGLGVGEFHPVDKKLEPVRDMWIAATSLGQRA